MFPSIVNRNINPYDTQNTMFCAKKKDLGKCHQLDVVPVSEHDSVNTHSAYRLCIKTSTVK